MTLQQLKYVAAVADNKSINKAATSLFITQPSLSGAIKELENISAKELVNLLKEVGSTRVNDGQNEESDFEGSVEDVD